VYPYCAASSHIASSPLEGPFRSPWGEAPILLLMEQIAAIIIASGAAVFFAAMAWVGNHVN
jgi:hypothetical protein